MSRDGIVGPILAALVVGGWALLTSGGLFWIDWDAWRPLIPVVVALQCWLYVGMFIVAHDAIHGTLMPGRPAANRAVGRACVFLYAGFDYDALAAEHHDHHRHSGTERDPDFDPDHPSSFWPWFLRFFRHYFGLREFAVLAAASVLLTLMGVPLWRLLTFWALPSVLSAFQLFYFGTYLPHRHEPRAFADRHNARSSEFSWLVSLLTCFHFGHHHAHHTMPHVPWWRLPSARKVP